MTTGSRILAGVLALTAGAMGIAAAGAASKSNATEWPKVVNPIRQNRAMEQRVTMIVSGMTLEQKIGQMTQGEIRSITPEQARRFYIGSILNGGGAWPGMNKHATMADWSALSDQFYQASISTDMKTQVPIIWGTDAVHGHNNLFGAVLYPHNIGLGAAHDPDLVKRIAQQTAVVVRSTGITWVFAPTLAVVQSPRWGRTYESYSSDPQLVRAYGKAYVEGLQGGQMLPLGGKPGGGLDDRSALATAKHFIGDGGTFEGKDQGENRASLRDLINVHAAGYYGALEGGVQTVMISYSSWNDVKAGQDHGKMHGNRELITGVLKGKLGFDGFVISDWNAIEQVPGCSRVHCPQAINAGVDMVMVPDDWEQFIAATVADVHSGVIPMSRIDDAVTRILRVKMRSGLFAKSPILPAAELVNAHDIAMERNLAREAVSKSLVLLKNNGRALPLKRASNILVIGEGADRIDRQTGGWSMTWQGTENSAADFPGATTILDAVRQSVTGRVEYSIDGKGVDLTKFDAVIAVASETPYAETKGDIAFPASLQHTDRFPADLAMLDRVRGKGVPVVTILLSGRPTYINDLINRSDAFVAAWLPGTEGLGVADGLFLDRKTGRVPELRGRLPFDWPGVPCPNSKPTSIGFPRGYGLTYLRTRLVGRLMETKAPQRCAVAAN